MRLRFDNVMLILILLTFSIGNAYAALTIEEAVSNNLVLPINTPHGLSCTIRGRLLPGGEVVGADVVEGEGSGNPGFDRSVLIAVKKASPLPVPSDPALFEIFREFKFKFHTKD